MIEMNLRLLRFAYTAEDVEKGVIGELAHHIQFAIGIDVEYPSGLDKEMSPVAFIRNIVLSLYYFKRFALLDLDVIGYRNSEMS